MTGTGTVEHVGCRSAEEFLDHLGARASRWTAPDRREWLYRGHADATWKLLPRAVRDADAFTKFGIARDPHAPLNSADWSVRRDQMDALLHDFRALLNRVGVPVPVLGPRITSREHNHTSTSAEPPRDAWPLMALAQHHGLPTLFLDWTRRAWIAAYHAAVVAARGLADGNSAAELAVWALLREREPDADALDFRFYEPPGETNPYLRAQVGLFSLHVDATPLEETHTATDPVRSGVYELRRVVLPTSEAAKLLRLLAIEGIDGASVYPGADGIIRALSERALWDQPRRRA